ncbi:putative PUA-like superfamily protein [Helianthus debilis subsp. tardiflorus]
MHTITPLIHEDSSLKQKEYEWNNIIREKGSDLIKMLETVEFELHVQEPFFSQLKDGHKTIEGRCAGRLNRYDIKKVDVHLYASFSDMLAAEGLAKVLPGVDTIEEGIQIYRKFYSEEREKSNGVLAILVKPTPQLYDHLASILAALCYDGIQRLLGISQTVGTVPDALPLPRSTLLSAFTLTHNPDV